MYVRKIYSGRMIRQPVNSTNLRSVGYDPGPGTLEIEFTNGSVYQYLDIPATVHQGLVTASSHRDYFARQIRDRYPYRKIE